MAEPIERRKADRRAATSGSDDIGDKLEALVGLLTVHMTGEEKDIAEIKKMIGEYFDKIEAHTHVYHHEFLEDEITDKKERDGEWKKIKTGLKEKAIIFIFGALMSWIGGVMWIDFADRVKSTPDKPAVTQPAKQDPNAPNHP